MANVSPSSLLVLDSVETKIKGFSMHLNHIDTIYLRHG